MTTNTDDDNIEIIRTRRRVGDSDDDQRSVTDLVQQPAKVMRIGTMIKQLLEEVRAAPLDEASHNRLREIRTSMTPRTGAKRRSSAGPAVLRRRVPSDAELRIAQAQLVGWLEVCSTGSRRRCSPSRWPPGRSSTHARPGCAATQMGQPGVPGGPSHGTGQYL
jgi:hypothetical protein